MNKIDSKIEKTSRKIEKLQKKLYSIGNVSDAYFKPADWALKTMSMEDTLLSDILWYASIILLPVVGVYWLIYGGIRLTEILTTKSCIKKIKKLNTKLEKLKEEKNKLEEETQELNLEQSQEEYKINQPTDKKVSSLKDLNGLKTENKQELDQSTSQNDEVTK